MTVSVTDFREATDDHDPGSANVSIKGGKAKVSYYLTASSVQDFHDAARLILGQAQADPSGGPGINRIMPLGHPRLPTLFSETITDFAGMGGQFTKIASFPYTDISDGGAGIAPNFPLFAMYPEYRIDVEFSNRLYTLIPDAELGSPTALDWNDDTGTGANVPMKCWDTMEYNRWTWTTGGPKESIITARQGQMVLDTGNPITTQVFPDMPKMPLPDGAVLVRWQEVPYSFVRPATGMSWFQQFQGRVNQFSFGQWAPGELLYVTIQAKPYKSPIPTTDGFLLTLCDVDIILLETSRLIATGDATPSPALANWIAGGFNLQPWFYDKNFHYAHVGNLASAPPTQAVPANKQTPSWKSFPFQILFSNPSAALPT